MIKIRIISSYIDNKNNINLICRDNGIKTKKLISGIKPYLLIDKKDRYRNEILDLERSEYIDKIIPEGKYIKIYINSIKNVYWIRDKLEEARIKTYESDIFFIRKYMIDNLIPMGDEPLKFLFIDIETDDTNQKISVGDYPILSIGCINENGEEAFFISNGNERKLLNDFIIYAQNYDVLVGWNSSNFDFLYIEKRILLNQIFFDTRYWQKVDLMVEYKHRKTSPSYSLEYISRKELGEGKIKFNERVIDLWNNNKNLLKEYNLNDCRLMYKINKKLGILKFLDTMSSKTNCFIEDLKYSSVIIDTCILRKIRELNLDIKFPYRGKQEKKVYEGGYVLEPESGLHKDIIIMDFLSLYNKIMQLGLSPETVGRFLENKPINQIGDLPEWLSDYFKYIQENNLTPIIPLILKELEKEREYYIQLRNRADPNSEEYTKYDMLQYSVKVTLLSFYGILGHTASRYYDRNLANAITGIGRYLIKLSKKIIEEKGFKVLYMDTDSLFVKINESNLDEIIDIGNQLTIELNNFYFNILETFNVPIENRKIEMKFEKVIDRLIFVGDEKKASKKRYAGMQVWEEGKKTKKLIVKGLEFIRTDGIEYTRRMQKEIIEMIFEDKSLKEIKEFLLKKKEEVMSGAVLKEDITLTQSLIKPVKEYKTDIPHIKVARQMIEKGQEVWVGQKIPYILIKGETKPIPIPADDYKDEYDDYAYWNQKIFPAIERIVEAVYKNENWKDLYIKKEKRIKEKSSSHKTQQSLF